MPPSKQCYLPAEPVRLVGTIEWRRRQCGKVECNPSEPCCQPCTGEALFVSGNASAPFPIDLATCNANNCGIHCRDWNSAEPIEVLARLEFLEVGAAPVPQGATPIDHQRWVRIGKWHVERTVQVQSQKTLLSLVYEVYQCRGDNGLEPSRVKTALRVNGIWILAMRTSGDFGGCRSCYPACKLTQSYEIELDAADRERARRIVEEMRRGPNP